MYFTEDNVNVNVFKSKVVADVWHFLEKQKTCGKPPA